VGFVPGRAANTAGRRGASSMRLNFAGVPDDDIREGIRRIGKVVREQVGLYGTLTGSPPARAKDDAQTAPADQGEPGETVPLADIVAFPRREQEGPARRLKDR
jgi:2-aminoadipate transaminase